MILIYAFYDKPTAIAGLKGEKGMSAKRILLEIGSSNDLHGGDYTKAAVRAVDDALHHSSLVLLRTLNIDPSAMMADVTVGVQ